MAYYVKENRNRSPVQHCYPVQVSSRSGRQKFSAENNNQTTTTMFHGRSISSYSYNNNATVIATTGESNNIKFNNVNSEIVNNNNINYNNGRMSYEEEFEKAILAKSLQNAHGVLERQSSEYIPSFMLLDLCKSANERKVKELVQKMENLLPQDVDPVVNFQDHTGRTSLSYACSIGNFGLVNELCKLQRLNPDLADNEGNTPLHHAAQAGHAETLELLLSRFAGEVDVNCRNRTGLTPLMKAALQGRTRCAKSLIAAGADSRLRDYTRNLTAAEWARLCGRHICAEVITKCAKDNYHHRRSSGTPPVANRPIPPSQSAMELKRGSKDETPYYHFYTRSTVSGATWLKNKIKKVLGSTTETGTSSRSGSVPFVISSHNINNNSQCTKDRSLMSNSKQHTSTTKKSMGQKMSIPTLQVTPVTPAVLSR